MRIENHPDILLISNAPCEHSEAPERVSEAAVCETLSAVEQSLHKLGLPCRTLSFKRCAELLKALQERPECLVFNLCEGLEGYSGFESHVAAVLEMSKIPFTGNNALTLALARNKNLAKKIMRASGILTPNWCCCHEMPEFPPPELSFPMICKPACEDASLGIMPQSVVRDFEAMKSILELLLPRYAKEGVLLEEFVEGREFNVAIMPEAGRVRCLGALEIDFSRLPPGEEHILCHAAKWLEKDQRFANTVSQPAINLPQALQNKLSQCAMASHQALLANSYGRVDMRLDRQGRLFVLEYNPNPDIGPAAGFSKALQADNLSYEEFVLCLIAEAQDKYRRGVITSQKPLPASVSGKAAPGAARQPDELNVEIRELRLEDRSQVLRILSLSGMFSQAEIEVADELLGIFLQKPEQKDYCIHVASLDGELAGYVCFGPSPATAGSFDLYWIAVHPRLQSQGIGKKLLRFVEQECRSQGGRLLIIETSSRELYAPTQAFYARNGYRVEARIKDYYAKDDDRLIYTRKLQD
ncbi:MAG: GNAT family N-acetyltransferase [Lentisphaeria bacterium]|jgi:D-alanine-D-alanine ligase|nr:GNAT family N-acetyltransferase [Lentisphaerota bacterium]